MKTQTLIRTEPELDRLAKFYSTKMGCPLSKGSQAMFYRIAAKKLLLEMSPGLRNITTVDWLELDRYTATCK
jgi:hypothetical protein